VIVPGTGTQIGAGLQGPVFKYELDPALGRRPVVLKYDSNGLNEDARRAGIPELNPQQSVRAVAAFEISQRLNLGIIPKTEIFVGTDDNGRPKLGQTMEFVNGAIGLRTAGKKDVPVNQKEIQEYEDKVKNPDKPSKFALSYAKDMLRRYVKMKGQWYEAENVPVNINYGNAVVQKGLSDLQVFDYIIGHADRNPGNWIYEKKGDTIIGVKGIDNDDTFGEKWLPLNPDAKFFSDMGSKTPGIPPIVDISTALSILNADFAQDIQPLLAGLSKEEIDKAAERFDQVQQQVESRVMAGKIASIAPTGDAGVQAKLEALRNLTGASLAQTLRWGNLGIADTHTEQNSYLGYLLAQKNRVGVVPESGDVLV
jgi:hypothetical protein